MVPQAFHKDRQDIRRKNVLSLTEQLAGRTLGDLGDLEPAPLEKNLASIH